MSSPLELPPHRPTRRLPPDVVLTLSLQSRGPPRRFLTSRLLQRGLFPARFLTHGFLTCSFQACGFLACGFLACGFLTFGFLTFGLLPGGFLT